MLVNAPEPDFCSRMLEKNLSGLYHVVGAQAMSKYQFGVEIARRFGLRESLISPKSVEASGPDRPAFPQFMAVYPQTIHRFGAAKSPSFSTGLDEFYTQFQQGYPQKIRSYQQ